MNPEVYLDTRKLNASDLAAILVENRNAGKEKRIKPYDTWVGLNGETPFPVGTETLLKRKELEGVKNVQRLARQGNKLIVWTSPPGSGEEDDECKYIESRILVYQVKSIEETKVNFSCVAICGQHTPEECLKITRKFIEEGGKTFDEIKVAEDLRNHPVALSEDVSNWVDYLEKKVPGMPEVWEAIRLGLHEKNNEEMIKIAEEIVAEFEARAKNVNTYREAVFLGATIERTINSRFNISLLAGCIHGVSNQALIDNGAFDSTYRSVMGEGDSRLKECQNCHNYFMKKKGKCPKCYPEN